jgi:probable rRNA maturation factor
MDDRPQLQPAPDAPRVLVSDRQDDALDVEALIDVARRALESEGVADGELSLSFVTSGEMADLHVRYMGEEGPTDVLSFPLGEEGLLGDVVVCPEEARRNNPADPPAELRLLVVHGVLHLLGYDHEEDRDRAEMWARQERYAGVRMEDGA